MGIVDSLFLKLGVQVDQASLTSGLGALREFASGAAALFAGFKVTQFYEETAKIGAELDDLSQRFGISTADIQKFQFALQLSGVDAENAGQSFRFLEKNLQDAATGGAGANEALQAIGVSAASLKGLGFNEQVGLIADGFKSTTDQGTKLNASIALFGRAGANMLPLLNQGAAGIREMGTEAENFGLILSEDFVRESAAADDAVDKARLSWKSLTNQLAVDGMPVFRQLVDRFAAMARGIRDFVKDTNIGKYIIPGAFAAIAVSIGGLALRAGKLFGIVKDGMSLFQSFGAIMKASIPVAIVTALALALEDVYVWLTGGQSVIGGLLQKFLGFEKAEEITVGVRDALSSVYDWMVNIGQNEDFQNMWTSVKDILGSVWELIKGITGAVGNLVIALAPLGAILWDLVKAVFPFVQGAIEMLIGAVLQLVSGIAGLGAIIGTAIKGGSMDEIGKVADKAWEGIRAGANLSGAGLKRVAGAPEAPLAPTLAQVPAAVGPDIGGPSAGVGGASSMVATNNITINTTADPKAVGSAVRGAVDSGNRQAFQKYGVAQ